ncbi:beta-lactamase domain protein [Caldicellulosiruptor saccharolyticus DSM 8903]|uniref:Beta-lactamase domain protein n=1 Tax=Caldicellulosiruptor saccharolyticus (strain ATCC 43494 / DSM 8903 / Tp8T 6331) TaxID=351627 RepID=A4XN16_CALS8|nr:N-acyl homoserine lactonase family protein [Caldicellulosiruptor saccharolyticus]ABP68301.1 beta-lactamase domain protein [Caldicellulosiruptor saccharolyticus DSM 8903]
MIYEIKPLLIGEFGPVHDGIKYRGGNILHEGMVPSFSFYIRTATNHILVDTGFGKIEECEKATNLRFGQKKRIEDILNENNIDPEEIELIICTHLHWDHIGNIDLFPNARVVFQLKELGWALSAPVWEPGYIKFFTQPIFKKINEGKVLILNGDKFINEVIKVIKIGGHTPGSQIVEVRLGERKIIISGDTIMTYKNIEEEIPVGLFYNLEECIKAISMVKEEKCIVLPSHDWRVLEYKNLLE